jgi:hypothetical protein
MFNICGIEKSFEKMKISNISPRLNGVSVCYCTQTACAVHPDSYPMGTAYSTTGT